MVTDRKGRYVCKTCKAIFFSYSEVVNHKGMTGHGEYESNDTPSAVI